MKTIFILFLLVSGSAFGQALNLDKAPLLDAPGPGYRQDTMVTAPSVKESLPRPQTTIYLAASYVATAKELGLPIHKTPIQVELLGESESFVTFNFEGTQYKVPTAAVLLIASPQLGKPGVRD